MKTRLLIIIGVIVIGIITALGIIFIFIFDYSPTLPIVKSQLQMVIDYCNDTSQVKNAILYYHSNDTHSIDNIDCKWKLHQNYPNSEYLCIPYIDKWVTGEEWRNQTHIFDKDSCKWKKDPEYDELNSKGCPQFCPKESILESDLLNDPNRLQRVLDLCKENGQFIGVNPLTYKNETHNIDANFCQWKENEN